MTTATVEHHTEGDVIIIRLSGEIDLANAGIVEEDINSVIDNRASRVRVDLSDVAYLDSAGLRILFTLADRLRTLQTQLELIVPSTSPVRRVVELSGLEPFARLVNG